MSVGFASASPSATQRFREILRFTKVAERTVNDITANSIALIERRLTGIVPVAVISIGSVRCGILLPENLWIKLVLCGIILSEIPPIRLVLDQTESMAKF